MNTSNTTTDKRSSITTEYEDGYVVIDVDRYDQLVKDLHSYKRHFDTLQSILSYITDNLLPAKLKDFEWAIYDGLNASDVDVRKILELIRYMAPCAYAVMKKRGEHNRDKHSLDDQHFLDDPHAPEDLNE